MHKFVNFMLSKIGGNRALMVTPNQLRGIPPAYRSHPIRIKAICGDDYSLSDKKLSIAGVARWTDALENTWHGTEKEITFEIISAKLDQVLGKGKVTIQTGAPGGVFNDFVKIEDNGCGFEGASLQVEVCVMIIPSSTPKHLTVKVNEGFNFVGTLAQTSEVYLSLRSGTHELGKTKKASPPTPVWNDTFQRPYHGAPIIEVGCFGINSSGHARSLGFGKVNLWDILTEEKNQSGGWVRQVELILLPGEEEFENQAGRVRLTITLGDK